MQNGGQEYLAQIWSPLVDIIPELLVLQLY